MSEAEECRRDGARLQPNSGRGKFAKGDYRRGQWLIDVKEYAKSFSVSRKVWAKLTMDAFRAGNMEPALKIVLGDGADKLRLFVISEQAMHDYMERLDNE